jgi:hypothetical protein
MPKSNIYALLAVWESEEWLKQYAKPLAKSGGSSVLLSHLTAISRATVLDNELRGGSRRGETGEDDAVGDVDDAVGDEDETME